MNDEKIVRGIKNREAKTLKMLIEKYTPYVGTISANISRTALTAEDREELAADVFLAVWNNPEKLLPEKLKAYIAALARNKTLNRLRMIGSVAENIEDCIIADISENVEVLMERTQDGELVEHLLGVLKKEDREIFIRRYYYYQTIPEISDALKMNPATVKTRLFRGRERMKLYFEKGMKEHENKPV